MPRTQIKSDSILDHTLTGASFREELNIWDETRIYNVGETVFWQGNFYKALEDTESSGEGDLSKSPDKSPELWEPVKSIMWSAYPSSAQTFNNIPVTLNFDTERFSSTDEINLNNGIVSFNTGGQFIINIEYTAVNTTNTRMASRIFIEKSVGDSGVWEEIQNSEAWSYNRESNQGKNTAFISIPLTINAGDKLRVRAQANGNINISTAPAGCNFTIFTNSGVQGPKGEPGPKGDTGAPGDIIWRGPYDSSISYQINEAVEYLGSSYVSIANNNNEVPSKTATNWNLIAAKGDVGSGSSVTISQNGSAIQNTPHSQIDFIGGYIRVTDSGDGVAAVEALPTKHKFLVPIWAEENSEMENSSYEWGFGNGANTPANNGMPVFVPPGYSCSVVALSLVLNTGSAEVGLVINGELTNRTISVDTTINKSKAIQIDSVNINNSDRVNFKTITASGTSQSNVVCAWLEFSQL